MNLKLLSTSPYLGRIPKEEELAKAGYRCLVAANYLLFYIIEGKPFLYTGSFKVLENIYLCRNK